MTTKNRKIAPPHWMTTLDWNGTHWVVHLLLNGEEKAVLTLDQWAACSASEVLLENQKLSA